MRNGIASCRWAWRGNGMALSRGAVRGDRLSTAKRGNGKATQGNSTLSKGDARLLVEGEATAMQCTDWRGHREALGNSATQRQ